MDGLASSVFFNAFANETSWYDRHQQPCMASIATYGNKLVILGCPVVDHLTIITRIDNIGKLYGQRLTYLHNL